MRPLAFTLLLGWPALCLAQDPAPYPVPRALAFAPDGGSLAVGSMAGKAGELSLWDMSARKAAEGAWEQIGGAFDERLAKALHRIGVPTRDEIASLSRRIEELTRAVERVQKPKAARTAKPSGSTGGGSTAGGGGEKKPPTARTITTTKDVTTTNDVVTKP